MNTSDTSTMSSERLAQYWIEGICMPCISFAGLIGSYNIFDSFYYIIRYLNYMYYISIIGVVAIGTLGTQALPNKERNLSIRNHFKFKVQVDST